jgi:hypothetical protein
MRQGFLAVICRSQQLSLALVLSETRVSIALENVVVRAGV